GIDLGYAITALVIDGNQFGFFGLDLIIQFGNQSRLENRVDLAFGRHAGTNRLLQQGALDKTGLVVLGLGFVVSGFVVGIFGHFRLVGVLNSRLLGVPFAGPAHFDFTARA